MQFTEVLYDHTCRKAYNFKMSRVLIVDDDAHIRELARVFLRNDGFEVIDFALA